MGKATLTLNECLHHSGGLKRRCCTTISPFSLCAESTKNRNCKSSRFSAANIPNVSQTAVGTLFPRNIAKRSKIACDFPFWWGQKIAAIFRLRQKSQSQSQKNRNTWCALVCGKALSHIACTIEPGEIITEYASRNYLSAKLSRYVRCKLMEPFCEPDSVNWCQLASLSVTWQQMLLYKASLHKNANVHILRRNHHKNAEISSHTEAP